MYLLLKKDIHVAFFKNLLTLYKYSDGSYLRCHDGSKKSKTSEYYSKSGEIHLGVVVT